MGVITPPPWSSSSSLLLARKTSSNKTAKPMGYKHHRIAKKGDISFVDDNSGIKTCQRTYVLWVNQMLLLQQDQALLVFRSSFQLLPFVFLSFSLENSRNNLTSCPVCTNCCDESKHCCPAVKSFCFRSHDKKGGKLKNARNNLTCCDVRT